MLLFFTSDPAPITHHQGYLLCRSTNFRLHFSLCMRLHKDWKAGKPSSCFTEGHTKDEYQVGIHIQEGKHFPQEHRHAPWAKCLPSWIWNAQTSEHLEGEGTSPESPSYYEINDDYYKRIGRQGNPVHASRRVAKRTNTIHLGHRNLHLHLRSK